MLVNMPPTLTLLTVAHEQLSRRSWCTNSDGALLLFTIEEVQAELQRAVMMECTHPLRADLEHMLEQCFYCLYGHPHRRKAKHLQDHNCKQVRQLKPWGEQPWRKPPWRGRALEGNCPGPEEERPWNGTALGVPALEGNGPCGSQNIDCPSSHDK